MLVTLIAHTNDPEKTIAAAAKLCYSDAHIETCLLYTSDAADD